MSVCIEELVMKTFEFFHVCTRFMERLKDFYDFIGQKYKQILGYACVRWLSLLLVLDRIMKIYPSLKYYLCQKHSTQNY
jgi:hypothetical protein